MTFAEKIISFYKEVGYSGTLPDGISIMNPFRENPEILPVTAQFYHKFYNDHNLRHLILGINPGRHGAGVTGIPFTDTKRLIEKCGLSIAGVQTFETSSVFVYEMIEAFGGTERFYGNFYISSVSPLGFTSTGKNGNELNYNYYDSRELTDAVYDFMIESIEKQLNFGIIRDVCFCLGTGKNYKFIHELNNEKKYFGKIVPLEHPRFIMQYKSKQKQLYISKYIKELSSVL
ncbi:MAG: DUF4918 family protein [Bacteroidales bacterium]|nr:DUF4918 family protein [Bacteroidales bacterium]